MGMQVPYSILPKFRRKAIYGKYKADIWKILRELCAWRGVEIIEAHACVDHVHMYVKIPPKMSVSYFMGYLKGKSTLLIFERHVEIKYRYGSRHFWCRGYYVSTVGKNTIAIKQQIANQLKADKESDQLNFFDPRDPFTGSK